MSIDLFSLLNYYIIDSDSGIYLFKSSCNTKGRTHLTLLLQQTSHKKESVNPIKAVFSYIVNDAK